MAEMSPEEFVRCIDFRYITDAITPEEAIEMLKSVEGGKQKRMKDAEESRAVPAYTTSAGWLGYGEDKMKGLLEETLSKGYRHFKLKVGTSVEADRRRLTIARSVIGYDKGNILMIDANQVCPPSLPFTISFLRITNVVFAGLVCPRSNRIHAAPQRVQTLVHRRAHLPRRHPGPQSHPRRPTPRRNRRRNRRHVSKPGDLQADPASGRGRRADDRRLPGGRGQREPGDPAAGG